MFSKISALSMIVAAIAGGHGKHGKHGGAVIGGAVIGGYGVGGYGIGRGYGVGGYGIGRGYGVGGFGVGGYGYRRAAIGYGGYRGGYSTGSRVVGWKSTAPIQYIAPLIVPAPVQYQYAAPIQYASPAPVHYAAPLQYAAAPVHYGRRVAAPVQYGRRAVTVKYATPAMSYRREALNKGYPAMLEASSGSGIANFQHDAVQDEEVHRANFDGPVTESVQESSQVQVKKVVTHHPVFYKNYLDHYTKHKTVNEDVYHHIGEEEARYFDIEGKTVGGGEQHVDHGKIGMGAYQDIVDQYGATPITGGSATMLDSPVKPQSFEYRRSTVRPYHRRAGRTQGRLVNRDVSY